MLIVPRCADCLAPYRREERKRHEEAVSKLQSECEERVRGVEEEARREREAMRRAHDKQVGLLRAQSRTHAHTHTHTVCI